jgi:hypothetical protein
VKGREEARHETVDQKIAGFGGRLDKILGRGRIPRSEKKAKAEEAMRVVDDLVEDILRASGKETEAG